ncbi:MAG: hypothetical protein ACLFPQ_04005 [Candidatus Woesearchaeota archaeon]
MNLEDQAFEGCLDTEIEKTLTKTGLSDDYVNEYCSLDSAIQLYELGREDLIKKLTPLKRYDERYPDLVTDENRERVEKVNTIVDEINENIESGAINVHEYKHLLGAIDYLIFDRLRPFARRLGLDEKEVKKTIKKYV